MRDFLFFELGSAPVRPSRPRENRGMNRLALLSLGSLVIAACEQPTQPQVSMTEVSPNLTIVGDVTTTDLGTLGGTLTHPTRINNRGQVVGHSRTGFSTTAHAFLWENGTMQDLGVLAAYGGSHASDINDLGQVVGASRAGTQLDGSHAFLWENGTMLDLGTLPGGGWSSALFINESTQIVGRSGTSIPSESHAFLWENGTMRDLGTLGGLVSTPFALNDAGQVVGSSSTMGSVPHHAFLWADGVMQDLGTLGGSSSRAIGINAMGQVIGNSETASGETHGFLWDDGVMQDLGTLGGESSEAVAINDLGQIVGVSLISSGEPHVFLWEDGTMRDLGSMTGVGVPIPMVTDINNSSQVIGWAVFGSQSAFLWEDGIWQELGQYRAFDINEVGQVVGFSNTASSAALWTVAFRPATPEEEAAIINALVTGFVDDGTLTRGQGGALTRKVGNALDLLDRGNVHGAIHKLGDYIDQVNALVNNGTLTPAQGQDLIDPAQAIVDQLTS